MILVELGSMVTGRRPERKAESGRHQFPRPPAKLFDAAPSPSYHSHRADGPPDAAFTLPNPHQSS